MGGSKSKNLLYVSKIILSFKIKFIRGYIYISGIKITESGRMAGQKWGLLSEEEKNVRYS